MFVWYVAVTRIEDKLYWYNTLTDRLTDSFGPDVLSTHIGVLYTAQDSYPNLPWVLENITVAYQSAVYGPVIS